MSASSPVQWQFGSIVLEALRSEMRTDEITDAGSVNVTATKHTVTVEGTLARGLSSRVEGESPAETFDRLKNALMRHRRYFVYAPFGKTIIEVGDRTSPNDPDANRDHANGPKVVSVRPVQITEAAFVIEVVVEATLAPCDTSARKVLNHHFKCNEHRDMEGYRTRTIQGTIVCRDRGLTKQQAIEAAGIPAVPAGYQETDFESGWLEDGLTLTYSRTEEQYTFRPPDEAADAKIGTRIETRAGNAAAYGIIAIDIKGNVDRKYREVVARATTLAFSVARGIERTDGQGRPLPVVSFAIQGSRGSLERRHVVIQLVVLVDLNKITAGGMIRDSIFSSAPSGMHAQGSAPYLIPADAGNETDLPRPPLQEPCEALVGTLTATVATRPPQPAAFPGGLLVSAPAPTPGPPAGGGFPGGTLESTPGGSGGAGGGAGGTDGGGGNGSGGFSPLPLIPGPNGFLPLLPGIPGDGPNLTGPTFPPDSGLPPAPGTPGGAPIPDPTPLSVSVAGSPAALFAAYQAQALPGGTGVAKVNSEFGGYGKNPVANSYAAATAADPADDPSTYTVYLIESEVKEDTGWRMIEVAANTDPKTGKFYPNRDYLQAVTQPRPIGYRGRGCGSR